MASCRSANSSSPPKPSYKSSTNSSNDEKRRSSSNVNIERVAGWVTGGIYAAFWTSLDKCSCVKLDTIDTHLLTQQPFLLTTKDLINTPRHPTNYGFYTHSHHLVHRYSLITRNSSAETATSRQAARASTSSASSSHHRHPSRFKPSADHREKTSSVSTAVNDYI